MKTARVVACPSCGAPIAPGVTGRSVQCKFCEVQIELLAPAHASAATPPPTVAKQDSATFVWLSSVGGIVLMMVIVGVVQFARVQNSARPALKLATTARPAPAAAMARVSMTRLAGLEVGMKLAQAQARIPVEFPEAEPDMHRKEFSFDVDDPIFESVRLSWEWGCDCLEGISLRVKDYPTELAVPKGLIPCLEQKFGSADSNSSPPYHYYWSKIENLGRLSYDTGTLYVSLQQRKGAPQDFRHLVETVAARDLVASKR